MYNSIDGATGSLALNENFAFTASTSMFNDTEPTSTEFTLGSNTGTNGSGNDFVAYLFASMPGISKVGSYTGTGAAQDIDCGFTTGARFVMIKSTSATTDWYVWDTARGIVSGTEPRISLNTADPEVNLYDWIDPLSSGFRLTSASMNNGAGVEFLYYAIALIGSLNSTDT